MTQFDIAVRLLLATGLGATIGIERELHQKPAGHQIIRAAQRPPRSRSQRLEARGWAVGGGKKRNAATASQTWCPPSLRWRSGQAGGPQSTSLAAQGHVRI